MDPLPRDPLAPSPHGDDGVLAPRRFNLSRLRFDRDSRLLPYQPKNGHELSIAAQVANLMRDLQEKLGLTYLFISHDLQMVELIAHQLVVMYLGQIVEMAPSRTLSENATHPYSRLLWSAADAHTGKRMTEVAARMGGFGTGSTPGGPPVPRPVSRLLREG